MIRFQINISLLLYQLSSWVFLFSPFLSLPLSLPRRNTIASRIATAGIIQCQWLINISIHLTPLFSLICILSGRFVFFMWMNAFVIHSENLFIDFTCGIGALCKLVGIHTELLHFGTYKTCLQAMQPCTRLLIFVDLPYPANLRKRLLVTYPQTLRSSPAVTAARSSGTLKTPFCILPKIKTLCE